MQTLPDLPKAAPYLFVSPDYSTDEAKRLKASVPSDIYRSFYFPRFCTLTLVMQVKSLVS